ncbi:ScyD/ScyE family protein [Flavisolibacter sp. BT320]|nr:ScyD/ScyE family protein [Flavisolibacter longurius]
MKKVRLSLSLFSVLCLLLGACKKEARPGPLPATENEEITAKKKPAGSATVSVLYKGLNNPRGLKFGPDGNLYVAEAGTGGTMSTAAICPDIQVGLPVGPFTGSPTSGGVSKISMEGQRTVITDQLASSQDAGLNPSIMGPSDVAFIGNTLYVLMAGAGCSHGVTSMPNGIFRINPNGSATLIANLGAWLLANPAQNPADDFEPEGVWYSMVTKGNSFYAIEPNQGILARVDLNGQITEVADISATQGHIVPTALAYKGNFYFGNLGTFPIQPQSAIYKANPAGKIQTVATGFSAILGLVIDQQSRMYVLEMTSGAMFPTPGTGRIVKVEPNGSKEVIVSGLNLPTGMTMGPDGNLYVSNWGFGMPPGGGEIVKVTLASK